MVINVHEFCTQARGKKENETNRIVNKYIGKVVGGSFTLFTLGNNKHILFVLIC